MTPTTNPELFWLTLTIILTGLLWLVYITQIISKIGPIAAVTEVNGVEPSAQWSTRAKKAHANAVENLVIFAPLVLIVHALGAGSATTAAAAAAYFVLRVIHAAVYIAGLPYLRTLAFAGGVVCQAILAIALLGHT
ncbi:MAPEG family protein [Erythrobacter alti]|uniref:MAPEG family protein n=1 Tax=Erythrobacter alti TaxID=1896145 RepID=UPI0030F44C74